MVICHGRWALDTTIPLLTVSIQENDRPKSIQKGIPEWISPLALIFGSIVTLARCSSEPKPKE
jgi:hypothetical protein